MARKVEAIDHGDSIEIRGEASLLTALQMASNLLDKKFERQVRLQKILQSQKTERRMTQTQIAANERDQAMCESRANDYLAKMKTLLEAAQDLPPSRHRRVERMICPTPIQMED